MSDILGLLVLGLILMLTVKACEQNGETFVVEGNVFVSERTGIGYPRANHKLHSTMKSDTDCNDGPSEVYSSKKTFSFDRVIMITVCK